LHIYHTIATVKIQPLMNKLKGHWIVHPQDIIWYITIFILWWINIQSNLY
jgi:hypothetical protein